MYLELKCHDALVDHFQQLLLDHLAIVFMVAFVA
jgi:hypothetical protein